jgi:hypothetical protein
LTTWFIDLPFKGTSRTWDMRVDWLYYQAGRALSVQGVQQAVSGFTGGGIHYLDTLPTS